MSYSENNTQLTMPKGYNARERMIFEKLKEYKNPAAYIRVPIKTRNLDGSVGELIICTPTIYSYGLSTIINKQTKKLEGYSLPLCLYNKNGPSDEERAFVQVLNDIVDHTKAWIVDNRKAFKQPTLEARDIKSLNPIWYKKNEDGEILQDASPVLYPKLVQFRKKPSDKDNEDSQDDNGMTICTIFKDEKGHEINPLELIQKPGYATAAIKIESIYYGGKTTFSLQVKVHEVQFKLAGPKYKSLLPIREETTDQEVSSFQKVAQPVEEVRTVRPLPKEDDTGSIDGDDSDDEPEVITTQVNKQSEPVKKAPVKRVTAAKK